MNYLFALFSLALCTVWTTAPAAPSRDTGDLILRGGAWEIRPKSDNNDIVAVDDGLGFGFNFTYMFADDFGVEVLAAMPFTHDILLDATDTKIGDVQHLPPTVSVQWHPELGSRFMPYVGAGLNVTLFFDETIDQTTGFSNLDVDTASFGPSINVGLDYYLSDNMLINLDVRYIGIETDASVTDIASGTEVDLGTIEIDPWVYGINFGWQF